MKITASLTAQNTFSSAGFFCGQALLVLSGTWSATVTLQVSTDGGSNYNDVTDSSGNVLAFTTNGTYIVTSPTNDLDNIRWRFGVKTGNYTSGTVVGVMQQ